MMKSDTEHDKPVEDSVFPLIVNVYGIDSINYEVNLETVDLWTDDVVKHNNVSKKIRMLGSIAPSEKYISDKLQFIELVRKERQLLEDFTSAHATKLYGFDKPIDVQLQRCALIIYLARCWEDWAMQMHRMFNLTGGESVEKQFKHVYVRYVIPYYEEAVETLKLMVEYFPSEMPNLQKLAWGKMYLYSKKQYLETISLYGDKNWNESTQIHYKDSDKLLVDNGLEHLLQDYEVEVKGEGGIFDGIKELIWSGWQSMCGAPSTAENSKYDKLSIHDDHTELMGGLKDNNMQRDAEGAKPSSLSSIKKKY